MLKRSLSIAFVVCFLSSCDGDTVSEIEGDAMQRRIDALEQQLAEMQAQVEASQALMKVMHLDDSGDVVIDGANLRVRNGSGKAWPGHRNGKGNIIIGYDTVREGATAKDTKGGSHCLVIGEEHTYNGEYCLVSGYRNSALHIQTTAFGERNIASGEGSAVLGGFGNEASGLYSVVASGGSNVASGEESFVAGGVLNEASGQNSSVSGGAGNVASETSSTVAGGYQIEANGYAELKPGNWVAN